MLHSLLTCLESYISCAKADTAMFSAVGVGLIPIAEKLLDIEMGSEFVEIDVYRNQAVIQAHFELVNNGPTVTTEVGFPLVNPTQDGWVPPSELQDFEVYLHRGAMPQQRYSPENLIEQTERRVSKNETYPLWRVWLQTFEDSETVHLFVRYRVEIFGYRSPSLMPLSYVLRTGRFWRGVIGSATVQLRCHEFGLDGIVATAPKPHKWDSSERTLTWQWTDLDPDFDISIAFSPGRIVATEIGMKYGLEDFPIIDPIELLTYEGFDTRQYWSSSPRNHWPEDLTGETVLIYGEVEKSQRGGLQSIRSERGCDKNLLLSEHFTALSHDTGSETTLAVMAMDLKTENVRARAIHADEFFPLHLLLGRFQRVGSPHDPKTRFLPERMIEVRLEFIESEKLKRDHSWVTSKKAEVAYCGEMTFPLDKNFVEAGEVKGHNSASQVKQETP